MGRAKGSLNKKQPVRPLPSKLSDEERVQFVANLIVDKILDDQKQAQPLLKTLRKATPPCQIA